MRRSVNLVTGATGTLGPLLVRRLQERGELVRVFTRRPLVEKLFADGSEVVVGELSSRADIDGALADVSCVYHMAARVDGRAAEVSDRDYERVNVLGTATVVERASERGSRLIFFSTISVYGPSDGAILTESDPPRPVGPYASTKRHAEEIVLGAPQPGTVLRLAAVYGSRMKGNYVRLIRALRRGPFVSIGDGSNRRTLVHQSDAVEAAILVGSRADVGGQVFNVTDGHLHSMGEILSAICLALNRGRPRLRVPLRAALRAADAADAFLRLAGRRAHILGDVLRYVEDVAVAGDKLKQTLGFAPEVSLNAGWRDAVSSVTLPPSPQK